MSQFILFERNPAPKGAWLGEMESAGKSDFLAGISQLYFPGAEQSVSCAAAAGDASVFINEAYMRIRSGGDIESARIVRLVKSALEMNIGFVFWVGSDYMDLPDVVCYRDFVANLVLQADQQPADVFMKYIPMSAGRGS